MNKDWLQDFKKDISKIGKGREDSLDDIVRLRPGERRTVSIMFLDLKGFTSLS